MSYSELLVALENIIIDKVATVPTAQNRKVTQALQSRLELNRVKMVKVRAKRENQRIVDLALQAVYKGTGKGECSFGKGQSWNEKGGKGGKDGEKNPWQKGSGKKGSKGQKKGGKGETRTCWTCGKT